MLVGEVSFFSPKRIAGVNGLGSVHEVGQDDLILKILNLSLKSISEGSNSTVQITC